MSDQKIRWKGPPTGSLARRVLLVSLSLLVVPLFLHSYFLYKEEYQLKLSDIQLTIKVIGDGQKALLEERLSLLWKILDTVEKNIPDRAYQFQVQETFLPDGKSGQFAYIDSRSDLLVVGKEAPFHRAFVITMPTREILYQLTHFEQAPYPISLVFVPRDKKVPSEPEETDELKEVIPIIGADFSLLLTVPLDEIRSLHQVNVLYRFFTLLFFIGFVGGGLVWLIMKRVAKPLKTLSTAMHRISEGALHIRYTPDRMGFEINELGKQFNETLEALSFHQKEAEKERIGRERLLSEMKIGREIQRELLLTRFPEIQGVEIASCFLPAKEVGGDFYDLFPIGDGSYFLCIADTAGKGISACLYSLGLRSSLRALGGLNLGLSEMILRANDLFWGDVKNTGMFVSLWAGIYHPKKRVLAYSCQGHLPAILRRGEKTQELTTEGISLGAQKLDAITIQEIVLSPGDLLFLYTDGIVEAHNLEKKLFGKKRLEEFLLKNKKIASNTLLDKLLEEIEKYSEGSLQHDDITALSIQILSNNES